MIVSKLCRLCPKSSTSFRIPHRDNHQHHHYTTERGFRLRPISTSANFDFGHLDEVHHPFWEPHLFWVWPRLHFWLVLLCSPAPDCGLRDFCSLSHPNSCFCLSVFSWNLCGVFESRDPQMGRAVAEQLWPNQLAHPEGPHAAGVHTTA